MLDLAEELEGKLSVNDSLLADKNLSDKERNRIERENARTKRELEEVDRKIEIFGDVIEDYQIDMIVLELTHLRFNADRTYEVINAQVADLRCRVDGHDEDIRGINVRLDSIVGGFPAKVWLIAGFVGIIVGAIWAEHDFNTKVTSKNVSMVVTSHLSSNWAAALVGLIAAVIVIVLFLFIVEPLQNKRSNRTEDSSEAKDSGKKLNLRSKKYRATTEALIIEPVAPATAAKS